VELVLTSNWSNFWRGFASRGFVSDSWAFSVLTFVIQSTVTVVLRAANSWYVVTTTWTLC